MLDFIVGNDILSAIIAFALVLIPAIFLHELGHFVAAKAVGITVLEFGIGFPPRITTLFTRGETEYTLNWLPIGGFVRPLGEDFVKPTSTEEMERDRETVYARLNNRADLEARGIRTQSVSETGPLKRIIFMAAGAGFNMLTAIVLFAIVGLLGVPAVVGASVGVARVEAGSTFAEAGLHSNDLIEKINGEYFTSVDDLTTRLNEASDKPVTLTVLPADSDKPVEVNLPPTAANNWQSEVYIVGVSPNSPAESAGLQPDDVIVAFNGEPFKSFEDLPSRTQDHLGQTITLTVLRDGKPMDVDLVPRANPPEGEGSIGVGIYPAFGGSGVTLVEGNSQQGLVKLTPIASIQYGLERIGDFVHVMASLPGELVAGTVPPEDARIVSPLGISSLGSQFLRRSVETNQPALILNFIAIINVALGITNLLPLPALDGGRILFVLIEMVRGRPIAPEREGLVHLVGMVLLLSLMAIAFINDVIHPITTIP